MGSQNYLSDIQVQLRVECAQSFLKLCKTNPNPVLKTIFIGDESSIEKKINIMTPRKGELTHENLEFVS